jgi:hypothetical protein
VGRIPAGHYLLIFKANKPGDEGQIDLTVFAYKNRKVELCHNGIDDDGNGLIDCADPACVSDPGCGSPVCAPDVDFGTLQIGQSGRARLDVAGSTTTETVSCARGPDKARVIQLTLAQHAGIAFDCRQTGQQVLGLFSQAGPRDGCDKNELSCADPQVLPFGCNFEIPNLQAGVYYVIAEGFQPGSEGTVDITLTAVDDRALEICNNGIDDDMDGFTDCADKKCATSPYCVAQACTADMNATFDPMPLNGMPVFANLNTMGAKVLAQPSCEAQAGGATAVVFLRMPGPGNLQVDYFEGFNATGTADHVLALYPDIGTGLICSAGKEAACVATMGAMSGTAKFPNLAQGPYWLVLAASRPGSEGPVDLKLTASP